jgi:uncharacterized membrane protein YozB (DUF420 family)
MRVMKSPGTPRGEHRFFVGMSLLMLGAVALGFARTLYLRPWFPEFVATRPSESIFLWHGVVFSLWMLLLTAQTALIAGGAPHWHRRVGLAGAAVIALVALTGWLAARTAALRPEGFVGVPLPPEQFLIVPLDDLAFFVVLTTLGILARRRPAVHKRLMLIGTVPMLDAAIFRGPFAFASAELPFEPLARLLSNSDVVLLLFLLPLPWWDLRRLGRVHPVTAWCSIAFAAYVLTRMPLGETAAWQALARLLLAA